MTNRFLPRGGSPFNQGGPPLPEWRRFFESLASLTDDASLQASLNALTARVAALEAEGSTDIGSVFGTDSIVQVGTLQSGNVILSLQGDESSPGALYVYGTDSLGAKGWRQVSLDDLADVDLTTVPPATGDALVFDGTAWVPGAVLANPMSLEGDMIVGGPLGVPTAVPAGTATDVWTSNGPGASPSWQPSTGGGSAPPGGIGISIGTYSTAATVLAALTEATALAGKDYSLTGGWNMWCWPSATIAVDVWSDSFGNVPTVGDSITGGSPPSITAGTFNSGTFTGPITIDRMDTLLAHINSNNTAKWVYLLLLGA